MKKKRRKKGSLSLEELTQNLKNVPTRDLLSFYVQEKNKKKRNLIKEELVLRHAKLVVGLARRFKDKGEPFQDIVQVAQLGLLNAIERYDPQRNTEFVTYAAPTIIGEIKRYFRDKGWTIRVPRRLQELNLQIHRVLPELTQLLDRKPTPKDLAHHLETTEEEILEALEIGQVYSSLSLDAEFEAKPGHIPTSLQNISGKTDEALESLSWKSSLREALKEITEKDRQLLEWRFFENLTQAEIASRLGVSQMQVSRLQKMALLKLRSILKKF